MAKEIRVRHGWLKFMYIYTIIGAGGAGLGMILMPSRMISLFRMPAQDPIMFGISGSVFLALAFLSIFGLRSPLKFAPLLLVELFYKSIWLIGIILPLWLAGPLPWYGIIFVIIFASFIIGDSIAIPFAYVFSK